MFKLNLKIALRNLWRNKGISFINIGGLAVALASFIIVMMYVRYELSFDKDNPQYEHIYMVGRVLPEFKTNYTSPPLAKAIKARIPEVKAVGLMKNGGFEFAISKENRTVFAKNYLMLDVSAARMFDLFPQHREVTPKGEERLFWLDEESMHVLFPGKKDLKPEMVALGSKNADQRAPVSGVVKRKLNSNIVFDALSVGNEIGQNEGYGYNNYNTYIQVQPETDIEVLRAKIDALYKEELTAAGYEKSDMESIFLDPLKNLHLRPQAGNDNPYKLLIGLGVLTLLMLMIAGINFTNLNIVQATKRAKEVGVKKVLGVYRYQLTLQFLLEIFMQCLLALALSLAIAELILPSFNQLFEVSLSIWEHPALVTLEMPLVLAAIALIAGIYPAMVLSGFKPALVLKGNLSTSKRTYWLRNGLLVVQFSIAIVFITGLLIISTQLKYMRTEDTGFKTEQVVFIKSMVQYSDPKVFAPFRERMMKIPGLSSVTVATNIPDGSENGSNGYTASGKSGSMDFVDVDFDYFETLGIPIKEGRSFSPSFKTDTANSAILNQSAVAKYGLKDPIGKTIRGCDMDYKIVGVVNDVKSQGFEVPVNPTIYTMKNPCGNVKMHILVKIDQQHMSSALAALRDQWSEINKMDGDFFRYYFMDDLYGKLFHKQERLQSVFFAASMLTVLIALLGLFAFARYMTDNRIKEIAVRKILGATDLQILKLLNSSFVLMVVLANCFSWPLAYLLTKKWLESFAYRIDVPVFPFVLSALITIVLTILTVSVQASKAVRANPVNALKYE